MVPEDLLPLLQPPVIGLGAAQKQTAQGTPVLYLRAGEVGGGGNGLGPRVPGEGGRRPGVSALPFLQDAESRPRGRRLQLKDLIPTEMQRLTKYPLLLQSIAQNTGRKSSPALSFRTLALQLPALASGPGASRVGVHPGAGLLLSPQKSQQNGRKWSGQLSVAGKFCNTSTMPFGTWRTCW